jgi:hypothetical protein
MHDMRKYQNDIRGWKERDLTGLDTIFQKHSWADRAVFNPTDWIGVTLVRNCRSDHQHYTMNLAFCFVMFFFETNESSKIFTDFTIKWPKLKIFEVIALLNYPQTCHRLFKNSFETSCFKIVYDLRILFEKGWSYLKLYRITISILVFV